MKELNTADLLLKGGDPLKQSKELLRAQASFLLNLASMLAVGLPVLASLKALQQETREPELKKAVAHVHDAIAKGSSLSAAMTQPAFSGATIMIVAVGEVTGRLDVALREAGNCLERRASLMA